MGAGTLTIYSASAGSGKTYNLASVYLKKLFKSRYSYRKILAVTFTHKATAEMKNRILDELNNLATGEESIYLPELLKSTGKSEKDVRLEAREILSAILHDYSRFSVSTIDSFFQKILRAFARDIGLHSGFNIEIDHSAFLASAVDNMIASAATDPVIRKWLWGYVRANIEDEKTWDIRKNIIDLSNELFSEKFRLISKEGKSKIRDKVFLASYIREMRSLLSGFEENMKKSGEVCLTFFSKFQLTDDMFYQRGRGVPGFIRSIACGNIKEPNKYVREVECNPPKWCSGAVSGSLSAALRSGLQESVREAIRYYDNNITDYNTANVVMSNIYTLGVLSDVLARVHLITEDENTFLLSDTGELIYRITEKDQTPFIYEKVGNTFESFMIDEFQDTSIIQWKNFRMLIDNSMAQGFENLVVGDIKQSIYRWRNSNWQTLHDLKMAVDNNRFISKPLDTNWRSCPNIIRFNNSLFSIIPELLDKEFPEKNVTSGFSALFSEVIQKDPEKKEGGYVRIEFVGDSEETGWQENVLEKLPGVIESVQEKGYNPSDIGILVRDNREGATVLKKIISYSSSLPEEKKRMFKIVSNDSLLLINAPVINFIISVLKVLDNPENLIGRALMLRNYLLSTGRHDAETVALECEDLITYSANFFPEGYEKFLEDIKYLTLWEITERTIGFFNLGTYSFNAAYLNSFQDIIVNFISGKNPGIPSFLDWWDSEGYKTSISLPGQQDAIRVLTIHKSKGLEFEVVILPFISWNLDHKSFHSNILWVKPGSFPFNKLEIVPVRYRAALSGTIFSQDYYEEKYSAYVDNVNLLYVALTRAKNGIFGFAPGRPGTENRIAGLLKEALSIKDEITDGQELFLYKYLDPVTCIFEFGELPAGIVQPDQVQGFPFKEYYVSADIESLKLKLHWEDYLDFDRSEVLLRVNYGKLMHEIFEEIVSFDDIEAAVKKKVLEGKLPANEEVGIRDKIAGQISRNGIKEWFSKGNEVLTEASILMPRAGVKRPDRIILKDGKTIIVDFKFGEENPHYLSQIRQYKLLLAEMGYSNIEAYLWYVDSEKIISA